jgi:hypothetical protein
MVEYQNYMQASVESNLSQLSKRRLDSIIKKGGPPLKEEKPMKGEKSLEETVEEAVRAKYVQYDTSFADLKKKYDCEVNEFKLEYRN